MEVVTASLKDIVLRKMVYSVAILNRVCEKKQEKKEDHNKKISLKNKFFNDSRLSLKNLNL